MFDEHRLWAERMCEASGLTAVEPLWGESTEALFHEWIASGAEALIVTARAEFLDDTWLGRPLRAELLPEFQRLGVDPCGERGEYHTVVTDSPLFNRPLRLRRQGHVQRSGCWAADLALGSGCSTMLRATDVSFAYRDGTPRVIDGVSMAIERGDLVGLLGPNGSGKTTMLKLIGGMLAPRQASVEFEGRRLADWPRREMARRIAYVPQETHAPFDFSVLEIVLMGRFPHLGPFALEGPEDLAVAHRALEATGTAAFDVAPVPHAQRRRKAARRDRQRAGAEPRAAAARRADGVARHRTSARSAAAADAPERRRDVTMVLSTHDLNFAASLCRRLVLIRDGRVLAQRPDRAGAHAGRRPRALRRGRRRAHASGRRPSDRDADLHGPDRCSTFADA